MSHRCVDCNLTEDKVSNIIVSENYKLIGFSQYVNVYTTLLRGAHHIEDYDVA